VNLWFYLNMTIDENKSKHCRLGRTRGDCFLADVVPDSWALAYQSNEDNPSC
jgi:hypothetical protein